MKKIALLCASALTALCGFTSMAQDVPNRLIVNSTSGMGESYVIGDINNISFDRVEGEVAAIITLKTIELNRLVLDIQRTSECTAFQIGVFPATLAKNLTSAAVASSMFSQGSYDMYYQDFTNAELSGLELVASGEYALVTLAYDRLGTPCHTEIVNFTAPAAELVGSPDVEVTITERTKDSFTANFKPNNDCHEYYCVAGEKGTMQQQYEMFGPMFGFLNMNDLIVKWGKPYAMEETNTWPQMAPNTEYEIFVAMADVNGNFAPYKVVETSTLSLGGPGAAYVEITQGDYKLSEWDGEMKPSQYISYVPNDQSSCYRFGVYLEELFNEEKDAILAELCSDPPMPMANWFFYDPITTDYQINPRTNYVVVAAAKNINGEWGEVNEKHFNTPASVQGAPTNVYNKTTLRSRDVKPAKLQGKGMVPAIHNNGKLIQK